MKGQTGASLGTPIAFDEDMPTQFSPNNRSRRTCKRLRAAVTDQRAIRFPLKLLVRYTIDGESGWGELVNISSSGALFTTERALPLGKRAELCIDWPALLLRAVHLKLVAEGQIVRVEPGRAALKALKYEFRTSGSSFLRETSMPASRSSRIAVAAVSTRRSPLQVQISNQAM